METIIKIQGDSYARDIISPDHPEFSLDWVGKWALVSALGSSETPLAAGNLSLSDDRTALQLRIPPTATESAPAGKYFLVVQLQNDAIGFKEEISQDIYRILPQGIPG